MTRGLGFGSAIRATVMRLSAGLLLVAALAGSANAQAQKPPPQTFVVYFGAGSMKISPQARPIIARAAAAIAEAKARGNFSHVKCIGYSDTVGSMNSAQRISERRAMSVRDQLIKDGVPLAEVGTEGRGKLELAVPTADQVKQPRNRRVRIVLFRSFE